MATAGQISSGAAHDETPPTAGTRYAQTVTHHHRGPPTMELPAPRGATAPRL